MCCVTTQVHAHMMPASVLGYWLPAENSFSLDCTVVRRAWSLRLTKMVPWRINSQEDTDRQTMAPPVFRVLFTETKLEEERSPFTVNLSVYRCFLENLFFKEPLWSILGSKPFSPQYKLTKKYFQLATSNQALKQASCARVPVWWHSTWPQHKEHPGQAEHCQWQEGGQQTWAERGCGGNIVRSVERILYVIIVRK